MLPNFFIVGAAKCGTSSLDRYLSQHPDIFIPDKKESHYFSAHRFPSEFRGPGDEGMNLYTFRELSTYERLFDDAKQQKAIGESSVFYLYYLDTAERIYEHVPHAKIIISLRNPVDRAFSAYMHLIRDERERFTFEESLQRETLRKEMDYEPMWLYKELGLYFRQVKRYLDVFGAQQVKVVLFEELIRNPQRLLEDVFQFLDVDPTVSIDTSLRLNESGQPKFRWLYNFISKPNGFKEAVKPLVPHSIRERLGIRAKSLVLEKVSMAAATRAELEQSFRTDISDLEGLLNRDLSIWRRKIKTGTEHHVKVQ